MSAVALIIVGAAAGFIATRLMKLDTEPVTTIAIGIFGALAGGLALRLLTSVAGLLGGFVSAVLGSMLLIWLWKTYFRRENNKR